MSEIIEEVASVPTEEQPKPKGWWRKVIPSKGSFIPAPKPQVKKEPSKKIDFLRKSPTGRKPTGKPSKFAMATNHQRVRSLRVQRYGESYLQNIVEGDKA